MLAMRGTLMFADCSRRGSHRLYHRGAYPPAVPVAEEYRSPARSRFLRPHHRRSSNTRRCSMLPTEEEWPLWKPVPPPPDLYGQGQEAPVYQPPTTAVDRQCWGRGEAHSSAYGQRVECPDEVSL